MITRCLQQQQQQRPFNGLWSGTTRVGRYHKEHSPTHTYQFNTRCLQIQPNQFLGDFQEISGIHFQKNSRRLLSDKPYNIRMQVKFVMSINEHMIMSSDQRSSLCYQTVQCTKNRVTCKNYIANYKIFQERRLHSRRFPVFPGAISKSWRFPGVVETLRLAAASVGTATATDPVITQPWVTQKHFRP